MNHNVTRFRAILAQFIVAIITDTTILSIGMMIVFPTLAIGDLHLRHFNEDIILNENEASWFAVMEGKRPPAWVPLYFSYLFISPSRYIYISIYFLHKLGASRQSHLSASAFCSILGALLQPYVGRKYGLILAFIPQVISWIFLSIAKSVEVLYLSIILCGVSAGLVEPPALSYLGEISEPRLRSVIVSLTSISFFLGILFEFFLGSIFYWRKIAAVNIALPVTGILFISFIPDSPIWLLMKGKEESALKSLCWLRGWVEEDSVTVEFEDLKNYVRSSQIPICDETNECNLRTNFFKHGWMRMTRRNLWQPLLLLAVCHFCYHSTSLTGMKSYFIEIFRALSVTMEPTWFLFINSQITICGGIVCFLSVKCVGKRRLILFSLLMTSLVCILLGACIIFDDHINSPWIPQILIWILHFFVAAGVNPIPWMLSSEIFSLSDRPLGVGLATAGHYVIGFPFSKTFYNLRETIHLSGCFILYGVLGFIGFSYLYLCLPETEGKSLAEIEKHFSKKSKKNNQNTVT